MKKIYPLPLILLTLASCAKQEPEIDPVTLNYETGVVIAKADFIGKRYATDTDGSISDCAGGVGIGITVESSMSDSSYIFDRSQKPCNTAEIVFDGSQDIHARAADPSIDIAFNDKYGNLSKYNNIEKTAKLATVLSDSTTGFSANEDLATKQYDQMGMLELDYNEFDDKKISNPQQAKFEEILKESLMQENEKAMATARAVARKEIEKSSKEQAKEVDVLNHKATKAEKYKQMLASELVNKTEEIANLEKEIHTLKKSKTIASNSYEDKLAMLEKRVEDYAQLALMLKRENEKLALTTKQANKYVAEDLTQAEQDAENARYVAMMKLAEDIEVDEKLAQALEISQKKTLQRKAQRLQTQADSLAYHAQADKVFNKDMQKVYQELQNNMQPAFEGKVARVVGVGIDQEPTLADVQLLLKEEAKSVNEILLEILADVQPMIGTWKVDWKLATHNKQIADEKWNVSAETTLFEFFEYIKERVKEIHGVDISIDYFDETRRIVINDNF